MKHRTSARSALVAVALAAACAFGAVALAGCGGETADQTGATDATTTESTHTVTDMQGNDVEVPDEITNLFNAYPGSIATMAMVGDADCMEYVRPALQTKTWAWLQKICPELLECETLGPEDGSASAEEVLSIDPDIVIVNNADLASQYREAGLNVFAVTSNSVDDYLEAVEKIGAMYGGESVEKVEAYLDYYQQIQDLVTERVSTIPEDERKTVYYQRGSSACSTIVGEGAEFITDAGAEFAIDPTTVDSGPTEITAEALLDADPDLIICGGNTHEKGYALIMEDASLSSLTAVQTGNVLKTPHGTVPWDGYGPERALMPLWLGKTLYPELFADIDLVDELQNLFSTFFDYELSDEDAQLMLSGVSAPEAE